MCNVLLYLFMSVSYDIEVLILLSADGGHEKDSHIKLGS